MGMKEETVAGLKKSIIDGKAEDSLALTKAGIGDGISVKELLDNMTDAMTVVGDLYARKEYFLPNVLTSANAFDKGFQLVQPLLEAGADKSKSTSPRRGCLLSPICSPSLVPRVWGYFAEF
jgi:5-methyltetrahydrofolate--homocysteine methyltransferase